MKRITLFALPMLLAIATPALAQDIPTPEQVVTENDKNGDKGVDRQEWAASPAPIPFPEEFDANKDGKMDVAEITAMFESFFGGGAPPPPAQSPAQQPAP